MLWCPTSASVTTGAYHQAPGLGIIIANPSSHLRLERSGDTDSFNTWKYRFSKAVRETSELKETTDSAELFQLMTLLRQLTNYKPKQRLANKPTTQGKTGTRTVCTLPLSDNRAHSRQTENEEWTANELLLLSHKFHFIWRVFTVALTNKGTVLRLHTGCSTTILHFFVQHILQMLNRIEIQRI